ncbi:penicillin-binding protein 1C [Roseibium hamelinense]|uniref:penicillin-binding protein 1C n=1 Tax=Roseibium hamelinense TaxID=150831 RepID=UPI001AD8FEFE|nr:penicillin-binding protein 1C [Roseibium hamelinense]
MRSTRSTSKLLIAYEDKRFYDHAGVDWTAMARALWQGVSRGRVVSGASTLTMQTARLLNESPTKTLNAKYDQVISALALERGRSKQDILSLYALRAPFGGNLEGVRAASLVWFGKEPSRLTLAEAALLVALPQSPEARRPDRSPGAARRARQRVLDRAAEAGVIRADEAAAAARDILPEKWRRMPLIAAHKSRDAVLEHPARSVHRLTLDRALQASVEDLLKARVQTLGDKVSAAVVVMDHKTGAVRVAAGGPDLLDEGRLGHVDMTKAVRSPGSTLKPLIYGLAFEQGIAHPDSLIEDRPIDFGGYRPTNFDQAYQGTVSVRQALQLSLNTPAVQLLDSVGSARLMARLKRAGVRPHMSVRKAPGLATALGGLGLTLEDLVVLYGAVANGGTPVQPRINRDGAGGSEASARNRAPVLSRIASWQVGDILAGLPQPLAAETRAIAYKTGTAYGHRDAWAIGFDGRFVVGVWTGRVDGTPVPGSTGATTATPLLFGVFRRMGSEPVPLPHAPPGLPVGAGQALPEPLRYARVRRNTFAGDQNGLRILYPPDGAEILAGVSQDTGRQPVIVKLTGGLRPFRLLVNGRPTGLQDVRHRFTFQPESGGFVDLTVIDAAGASESVLINIR